MTVNASKAAAATMIASSSSRVEVRVDSASRAAIASRMTTMIVSNSASLLS